MKISSQSDIDGIDESLINYVDVHNDDLIVIATNVVPNGNHGTIRLYHFDNDDSMSCLYRIEDAHDGDVECARFITCGNQLFLISCSYDITTKIWLLHMNDDGVNIDSHKLIYTIVGHDRYVVVLCILL
jgi:WD40 repeat protein